MQKDSFILKKKVAIIFPYFDAGGGGNYLTAWVMQTLRDSYAVTLLTCDKLSISDFNNIYGTDFLPGDFEIINPPMSFLLKMIPGMGMLKYHFLGRYFKKNKDNFDIVFGTYKEMDFGVAGIQYIHFPDLYKGDKDLDFLSKQYYNNHFLKSLYQNFCYFISGFNVEGMKKNITLTNSNWTKGKIKEIMGLESRVAYPPVLDDFIKTPWKEKERGFVCLGRICPEKRTKLVIEIVRLIREKGFDTHIHIIGPVGDEKYYKEIKQLQKDNPWIFLEGLVTRKNLALLLSEHKYGIHGKKDEHFGIGVVEMVKSGCIVFVPDNGGQVKIVGDERLTYKDEKDAVPKILSVLKDVELQDFFQKHLAKRANLFSVSKFAEDIRRAVEEVQGKKDKNY